MRSLNLLVFILAVSSLGAQDDFLQSLAVEVCNCLNINGADLAAEANASDCLTTVALRHRKSLLRRYGVMAAEAGQQEVLSELLVDDLLEVCPLLRTVRPEEEQREFRWSDSRRNTKPASPQFRAPKRPPADAYAAVTSEPPLIWRATGILLAQPGSSGLRLRTQEGAELVFDLPAAVVRKRDFDSGDEVSLSYLREWRLREGEVVLVVQAID